MNRRQQLIISSRSKSIRNKKTVVSDDPRDPVHQAAGTYELISM